MARALRLFVWVTLAPVMFAYFGLGGFVLSWVVLPLVGLGARDPDERVRRRHRVIARGYDSFHAMMRWAGHIDFDPRDNPVELPTGPCVVVANHPTLIDTTAVMTLLRSACLVVKPSFFRSPLFRRLHRAAWNIEAVEDVGGAAVIDAAVERLAHGFPVLIFPEGTRSPPGGLRRFRRGAFEIAARAGVPVLPLVITCDPPTLMKGVPIWALPRRTAVMRVRALPPVDATAGGERGSHAIARQVQALYDRALSSAPTDNTP